MTSEDQHAAPAPTSLANRYGGQKRALTRKGKRNILIAVLAVGIAFLAWVTTSAATTSVSFKDIGYSTTDATLTEVDFQVTKDPAADAKCAVKAMDSKFAIVGWKVVDIGPNPTDAGTDGGHTTGHSTQLRTESQAVSAVVDNCWIPDAGK
ncbi:MULTISPECIES: DUF4307 domain-containing protein [Arthrobacter]|uniref:DUF4307 domain-containing protein n=1 Tax=Arthrobacter humicola TaxID=409291 RepID=A0ABN2YWE4_9MICC|nr:DUF4307 domain-containing protein [Arthrobacter sp. H-02-3]PVZ58944.1 DUF4307 domain-containing protein [Arthrobacter sp. H-02-3]